MLAQSGSENGFIHGSASVGNYVKGLYESIVMSEQKDGRGAAVD